MAAGARSAEALNFAQPSKPPAPVAAPTVMAALEAMAAPAPLVAPELFDVEPAAEQPA